MPSFDVKFEVYCICGEGLCNQSTGESGKRGLCVTMEPCKKCKQKEYDAGYSDGYRARQDEEM
jgi:hypothetical protein